MFKYGTYTSCHQTGLSLKSAPRRVARGFVNWEGVLGGGGRLALKEEPRPAAGAELFGPQASQPPVLAA